MRNLYCAACGKELEWMRKAIPQKGIVMNLVHPHECEEIENWQENVNLKSEKTTLKNSTKNFDEIFNSFPFYQKLNKSHDVDPLPVGDRRSDDHKRKELTSSAPKSLIDMARRNATGNSHREMETIDE